MKIGSRPVSKPLRAPFRDDLAVQVKQVIIRKVRPEEVTPWIHGLVVVPKSRAAFDSAGLVVVQIRDHQCIVIIKPSTKQASSKQREKGE